MATSIDRVHDQIYISNITAVRTEPTPDDVDAVITVCQDAVSDNVSVEYCHFNMADGPFSGYGGDYSYEMFEDAAETVLDYLRDGDTLLVHCHAGQSRSPAVSIAALGVFEGESYYDTYDSVKESRSQIHPDGLLERHAKRFISDRVEHVDHQL